MRKILFLTCVLAISCASWAQADRASWANLNALQAGQKIQIVEMNSKKDSGIFLNVSDTEITYRDGVGERTVPQQDVRSVKLADRRRRPTLIGAAVGFGAGAGVGAGVPALWTWSNHPTVGNRVESAVGVGVIGLVLGASVGALLPPHGTICRANTH
jgi:hypothetical protein